MWTVQLVHNALMTPFLSLIYAFPVLIRLMAAPQAVFRVTKKIISLGVLSVTGYIS